MQSSDGGGRRSGMIRPFRSPQRMDETQAEKILADLKSAIHEIHAQNASSLSFEELYRNAYNLVLHKHGEKLYAGIEGEVTRYLRQLGNTVAVAPDEVLLAELVRQWKTHTTTMTMIRDILMYMDRTFVLQERKEPVYELGLRIFKEQVARHPNVKDRVRSMLLSSIEAERRGELIDKETLRNILQMLVDLGINAMTVYQDDFETPFLEETRVFYEREGNEYIQINTCPDYVVKAQNRLNEEKARAQQYLHMTTEGKLLRIVSHELVIKHASHLVSMPNSGCNVMLRDNKMEELHKIWSLFSVKNCRDEMKRCVYNFVRETGEKLVDDHDSDKKPVEFVHELLDLQKKFEDIVREAFEEDKNFQKAVKEAFEFFVNKNQRCAQYLSMYLDDLLRKKPKMQAQDDLDLNQKVDRVVVLFRYLQDKDIFENFYKQQLSKRLLSGRSLSEDAESSIIKKLKSECGQIFTSKLEGMFKDIKLSKETMERYRQEFRKPLDSAEPELHVTVLTAGYWPSEQANASNLPKNLEKVCEEFKNFYLNSHTGRRLTWQTNQGSAEIRAFYSESNVKTFNVSTYQMCILLLFNDADSLTFEEIEIATAIPQQELKRHLISLAAPRYKILLKEPAKGGVEASTKFMYNGNFTSRERRVQVKLVSTRQSLDGAKSSSVPEQVEEDRKHLIEAAIVRIMKARKRLEHNLLVAEVTKQMSYRFSPSPQQIKKRIESLIEREYLERDHEDRKVYKYLA